MEYFVSVEKYRGKACIRVRVSPAAYRRYPLTKAGCLEAGRDMFEDGQESWMNSSSVDFPEEIKRGFKWDVRELMTLAYQEAEAKAEAPRKSLVKKIMALVLADDQFLMALPADEYKAWEALYERVKNNEG